jgi:hypothetical protein
MTEDTKEQAIMTFPFVTGEQLNNLSRDELIEIILTIRADRKKEDSKFAKFEREIDAAKEVLYCELYDVTPAVHDLVTMANAARFKLSETRSKRDRDSEIPF